MTNLKNNAVFAIVITIGSLLPTFASAKHCKGVSTKWVNTCGSSAYGGHDCASKAEGDFHPEEWLKYSDKDCSAIQAALKNEDVKAYVVSMRDSVVETGNVKKLAPLKCATASNKKDCKTAKKILSTKPLKKYIKKIAKGTLVAKKRGKKF